MDETPAEADANPYASQGTNPAEPAFFPEPRLPTFVLAVTAIDVLLCHQRARMFYDTLQSALHFTFGSPEHWLALLALTLDGLVVGFAILGGFGVILHRRFGPYFQAIALAVAAFAATIYIPMHLYFADEESFALVLMRMVYGAACLLCWGWILLTSMRKTWSFFRLIDSPQTSSVKDLERLGASVEFQELSFAMNPSAADDLVRHLVRQARLVRLDLSATGIGDQGGLQLALLPRLEWLDLSNTQVTDAVFDSLASAKSLTELHVESTHCTPAAAAEFERLRRLRPKPGTMRVFI